MLGEAGGNLEVATAYGIARMHFPLKPGDEIAELVRNSLLELLRRGSHRFFRGDYSVGVDDVGPADRAEIVDKLEHSDRGLDFDRLLFFAGTEKGAGLGEVFHRALLREFASQAPALQEKSLEQIAALPLGSRIKVNPWTNQIALMQNKPISLLSAREKMPFEVTPFMIHLTRTETAPIKTTLANKD